MIKTRKYNISDYNAIIPFLKKFNSKIADLYWNNLLKYKWKNNCDLFGIVMESDSNQIVGFLSYIIGEGINSDREVTFCNLSSWVVNPAFRSKSIQMLSESFEIKNVIILNLTPHESTRPMFRALRFDVLTEYEYRINPFKLTYSNFLTKSNTKISCAEITIKNASTFQIDLTIFKLMEDMQPYSNVKFYRFSIIENVESQILILAFNFKKNKIPRFQNRLKEIPYYFLGKISQAEMLYSSSSELLKNHFSKLLLAFVRITNVRSVNVGFNFLNNIKYDYKHITIMKKDCPWFYYSETKVDISEIHLLYTEKVLLNI